MNDDKLIRTAASIFISMIVGPMIIRGACVLIEIPIVVGGNLIRRIKYNNEIKKGLKEGSIVCIDGLYYDVIVEDVEKA
jgi:hypothetical protein